MGELHAAISFNNHGVQCLAANNIPQATQAFQNSIQEIKRATIIHSSKPSKNHTNELSPRVIYFNENCCPVYFGETMEGLQNTLHYTFDRPMILQPPLPQFWVNNNDDDILESYLHLITMVVFFNMALTTHLSGMNHGRTHSLQQSIRLYCLAETMANESNVFGNVGEMMKWLILNNVASLHFELCDYKNFAMDFACLQESFRNNDMNVTGFANMLLDKDERNELMLNVFYFHVPSTAHAA